jgi:hypothetical protein
VKDNAIMRSRISDRAFLGLGILANRTFEKPFGEGGVMWSLTEPRWPQ